MSWTKLLLGVAVMLIYETKDNDLDVMLGTALFTNFVSKINEEEQAAYIWILPNQDDTGYIFLDTDHILKIVFRGIGLNWQADEQGTYTNQNQTLIMQAEDIESQAVWQDFLLYYLYRLFDCWWIFHKYLINESNNWDRIERPYLLKFKPAGIIDQMRLFDTNNTRLENGTMSRAKYIHIVDSIPMTFAKKEVEKIDKEQMEYNDNFGLENDNEENKNTGGIKDEFKQKIIKN
ncbi:P54 [Spiroplasma kunkelii CR2-3x]|uniref:p54 n=1 Tax=Spiroplasma kunkelii CR2-3x TaxID=273035 RepID=A0A0K2JHQ1_SPIKU|nr:hypothetical protein [Spiroplasma kunkelii]ALA98124.1 P54 [Spiroplasma kunkelii CR2-3x]